MKFTIEKYIIPYFTIVITFSSCCVFSLNNQHLPKESGYDFRARYSSHVRPAKFDNKAAVETVNVLDFGARGDGISDETKAFQKAWTKACTSSQEVNFEVPQKKDYLLKQIKFSGPCKSDIKVQISGTILASNDRSDYSKDSRHWIIFESVQNLVVSGGGVVNGNGNIWWKNSCKINKDKPCTVAPAALTFYQCTNVVVMNLRIQNAQQIHMSFEKCRNVEASNLVITSPSNSPNTDGIHVSDTHNIQISSSTIATGDDCVSIVSGSQKVRVTGITCGPGHGISIGSLGSGNSKADVSDVVVNGAKLYRTTNGVRIKTWQGGFGSASNIKFQNIEMENVENPIIIDQHYCDQEKPCQEQGSAVQVRDIVYQNIKGTSASDVAIAFDCSKSHPCQGLVLQNVNLQGTKNGNLKAVCNNVKFFNLGAFSPRCP